jgi:hypothetical protein
MHAPLLSGIWHNGSIDWTTSVFEMQSPLLIEKPDLHPLHEPSGLMTLQRGDVLMQVAELVKK